MLASNEAVGSVINRDFPIPYVLYGNKELLLSEIARFVNFREYFISQKPLIGDFPQHMIS